MLIWLSIPYESRVMEMSINDVASTLQKYAHQMETTGSSSDCLQLRLFS